jgi:uncharacterized damage-inducible protein DinB
MSEKAQVIKAIAVIGLDRLDRLTSEVNEGLLDWRPEKEANTIRWILTHESYILHVVLPWVFRGERGYKPEGWPDDYQGNPGYSMEKILGDLERGREEVLEALERLTDEELAEEIDFFDGRTREWSILWLISELIHHEGQVAAILNHRKRMEGK